MTGVCSGSLGGGTEGKGAGSEGKIGGGSEGKGGTTEGKLSAETRSRD